MAYQRLPEFAISFPLFKVSESWKFQMSSFSVSTDETHSSKQAIYFLIPNRMTKRVIFDTMAYQRLLEYRIGLPLLKVNEPRKFKMLTFCISTGICKRIWYYGSFWYPIASNMTNFFHSFQKKEKLPVLDYLFHLYRRKMETFGIFTAHWLSIKANRFDILETFSMPLCQIWLDFLMMPYFLHNR